MEFDQKKAEEAEKQQMRWEAWQREHREAKHRALEWKAYWDRRRKDDRDLWRDKDFANAVDKVSRAGYTGQYGKFDVPAEINLQLDALYMQATVGDYDGNDKLTCAEEWKKRSGMDKIESQREFIKLCNKTLTRYGWNPPAGWV